MKAKSRMTGDNTAMKVQFVLLSIFVVVWIPVSISLLLETLSGGQYLWLWLPFWILLNAGFVLIPLHALYLTYREIKHSEKEGDS